MIMRKIAIFPNDGNPDTNQWPINPSSRVSAPGGAQYPITIGAAEIELIKRENPFDGIYTADEKIQWAVRNQVGGIYYTPIYNDPPPWDWPAVIMGSKSNTEYNQVKTFESEKGKTRIDTIPKLDTYDSISRISHPWLFHRVWVTNRNGCYDSPKGVFWMPLFDAFNRRHPIGELTGMWIKNEYLGSEVSGGVTPPPPPPPPPQTGYKVMAIRRTVLRQQPKKTSAKIDPVATIGEVFNTYDEVMGWGYTGERGWILLTDTKPLE